MSPTIRRLLILGLATVSMTGGAAPNDDKADDADNWARLRATPRAERQRLSRQLEEFAKLPSAEQASIRELDRKVTSLPEPDRSNYHAALRRYHLWLRGLTEAQRAEIHATPPSRRMALVSKLMAEQSAPPPPTPLFARLAEFGGVSPFELAYRIKVWLSLTPEQKAELNRLDDLARVQRLRQLGQAHSVPPIPLPPRTDEDAVFEGASKRAAFAALKRNEEMFKQLPKLKQRLADHIYFVDNPPTKVKPEDLARFARDLPTWVRANIDPLPPDEARRRLTILYRLVFPAPQEYPAPKPSASPPASRVPAPAPVPKAVPVPPNF